MFVARFGHVDKQCAIPKTSPEILDAKALRAYTFYLVAYLLAGARPYIGATTRRCWRYFDAEVVQVVLGDAEVAAAFSNLPFDHLLFTGSTAVGRKVAMAAAQNLTLVTLELGGANPQPWSCHLQIWIGPRAGSSGARQPMRGKFTWPPIMPWCRVLR